MNLFWLSHLGETEYSAALKLQESLRALRQQNKIPNLLLLTSHPPVFTLGKRNCEEDFLSPLSVLQQEHLETFQTNRGGKITYHGPGQVVGYFIVDIRSLHLSIPEFVRQIEEVLIRTLAEFKILAGRDAEYPGVWVENKKIAALGLHFDRGVSMHGFALNVNPNLDHYQHIIPCGIREREVSSMEKELGKAVFISDVEKTIEKKLAEVFDTEVRRITSKSLNQRTSHQKLSGLYGAYKKAKAAPRRRFTPSDQ